MHLLLHPFTREREKKPAKIRKRKKRKMQKNAKKNEGAKKKTKTHIFKNEAAKKSKKEDVNSRRTMSTLAVVSTVSTNMPPNSV